MANTRSTKLKRTYTLPRETVRRIEKLAQETRRGKNGVVDWLLSESFDRIDQAQREKVSVEQALNSPG